MERVERWKNIIDKSKTNERSEWGNWKFETMCKCNSRYVYVITKESKPMYKCIQFEAKNIQNKINHSLS